MGSQTWGYNLEMMIAHGHPQCMLMVPIFWMDAEGTVGLWEWFDDMIEACPNGYIGPVDSSITRLFPKLESMASHNAPYTSFAYGPECLPGGGVPEEECADLLGYLDQVMARPEVEGRTVIYGPASELIALDTHISSPDQLVLRAGLMTQMAQRLRPGDIFFLRPGPFQMAGPGGIVGMPPEAVADVVSQMVQVIHNANPEVEIWAQLLLNPFEGDEQYMNGAEHFLGFREALVDLVDGTYFEPVAQDMPEYHESQLANMLIVFEATGCGGGGGGAGPTPTPTPCPTCPGGG
jgi:hypothetical protein